MPKIKIWGKVVSQKREHMLKVSPFAAYQDLFEPPMGAWDRQWEQELSAPRCITPERGWFEAAAASSMPQSHCAPQFRGHSPGSTVGISSAAPVRSARRQPSSGENDTPRSPGMPPSMLTPERCLQQQQQQQRQQRQQRQQQQQRRRQHTMTPKSPSSSLGPAATQREQQQQVRPLKGSPGSPSGVTIAPYSEAVASCALIAAPAATSAATSAADARPAGARRGGWRGVRTGQFGGRHNAESAAAATAAAATAVAAAAAAAREKAAMLTIARSAAAAASRERFRYIGARPEEPFMDAFRRRPPLPPPDMSPSAPHWSSFAHDATHGGGFSIVKALSSQAEAEAVAQAVVSVWKGDVDGSDGDGYRSQAQSAEAATAVQADKLHLFDKLPLGSKVPTDHKAAHDGSTAHADKAAIVAGAAVGVAAPALTDISSLHASTSLHACTLLGSHASVDGSLACSSNLKKGGSLDAAVLDEPSVVMRERAYRVGALILPEACWSGPVRVHTQLMGEALGLDWDKYKRGQERGRGKGKASAWQSAWQPIGRALVGRGSTEAGEGATNDDGGDAGGGAADEAAALSASMEGPSSSETRPVPPMSSLPLGDARGGGNRPAGISASGMREAVAVTPRPRQSTIVTRDGRRVKTAFRTNKELSLIERVQGHASLQPPTHTHPSVVQYSTPNGEVLLTPRSVGIAPRMTPIQPPKWSVELDLASRLVEERRRTHIDYSTVAARAGGNSTIAARLLERRLAHQGASTTRSSSPANDPRSRSGLSTGGLSTSGLSSARSSGSHSSHRSRGSSACELSACFSADAGGSSMAFGGSVRSAASSRAPDTAPFTPLPATPRATPRGLTRATARAGTPRAMRLHGSTPRGRPSLPMSQDEGRHQRLRGSTSHGRLATRGNADPSDRQLLARTGSVASDGSDSGAGGGGLGGGGLDGNSLGGGGGFNSGGSFFLSRGGRKGPSRLPSRLEALLQGTLHIHGPWSRERARQRALERRDDARDDAHAEAKVAKDGGVEVDFKS